MENSGLLQHMHSLHLLLADELKRICVAHHLRYFMIAGTLLGAVRHRGFIPWDDDMDFGMPREDYEKLLKICETELDQDRFYLQTDRCDPYYTFNFSKLRLKGTKVLESFSMNVNTEQGIYIDIFPIDAVFDSAILSFVQLKSFWFFRNLLWVKCGYGQGRRGQFGYETAKLLGKHFSISTLKKMKQRSITMASGRVTEKVVTSDGSYGLKKETLHRAWIEQLADYPFEDRVFPGIADYDSYLAYFYGDYMKLPPENKRNHHGRLEVDFGCYQ